MLDSLQAVERAKQIKGTQHHAGVCTSDQTKAHSLSGLEFENGGKIMNLLDATEKAKTVINELGLSQLNINLIAQIIKNSSDGMNINDSFKLALHQQELSYKAMESQEGKKQLRAILGV